MSTSVISHNMEPLFVDTNIQYDLDVSLFPGITDPVLSSQPALLIASSEKWTMPIVNCDDALGQCQNEIKCNEKSDPDDLYNFIDSFDLTNTDISARLMGTGELEAVLSDILESAAFNDEFDDFQETFSNCDSDSIWKSEPETMLGHQCTRPSSTTSTSTTTTSTDSSSVSLSTCDVNDKQCFDCALVHEKAERLCALSPSTDHSGYDHFFDTSFIDLLDLRDQSTSRKRKIDDCWNDGKACKLQCFQSEKDFFQRSQLSVLTWVTENTPHSSCGSSETVFPRGS